MYWVALRDVPHSMQTEMFITLWIEITTCVPKIHHACHLKERHILTVTSQVQTVTTTPAGATGSTNGLGVAVALAQTTRTLSSGCKTTKFTMFVHGVTDPVNVRVTTDGVVGGIDHDDLEVLMGSVLSNPVRVQHAQTSQPATDTFLSMR
uniref:Uncharacterized protein n=1 Tax=Anopheles melas TaxID=34690 RepID=A0A182TWM0_9DIPT